MTKQARILILDFGSQYTQLIARCVRELQVYSEVHACHELPAWDDGIGGIILSGSHRSVNDREEDACLQRYLAKIPVLGICYGAQWMIHQGGGLVESSHKREYGEALLLQDERRSPLLRDVKEATQVWMSHSDTIAQLPTHMHAMAHTKDIDIAAFEDPQRKWYGVQFHPEVSHTPEGKTVLRNFVLDICGCAPTWTPAAFITSKIADIQEQIPSEEHVLMGLSGGVDSSVAALLIHRALGGRLHGIFLDNGLLRKGEREEVLSAYARMGLEVTPVDAQARFYQALKGLQDPEAKRKAIGRTFIEAFEEAAQRFPKMAWLGQGTIYPDVIESASPNGLAHTIKSHHNVGGLPARMKLKILEPLRMLFKDEVREVGKRLGLAQDILQRHPFPGPGLGIRILGEVTAEKVALLQEADAVFIAHLRREGLYAKTWQAGAILLPIHTVGVMGDGRSYERVIALRAVESRDGMTAQSCALPHPFLQRVARDIINQVSGINRVVYDISSKPPATIEWE